MSQTIKIASQTEITLALAEKLELAICEAEKIRVPEEVQFRIDAIPFQIAAAATSGCHNATLFELIEGVNFIVPDNVDPYKIECPLADWLQGATATIFRYCQQAGLSPSLTPFGLPNNGALRSELTIDWAPSFLEEDVGHSGNDAEFALNSLKTSQTKIPYAEQDAVRKRVCRLLQTAPEILYKARQAQSTRHSNAHLLSVKVETISEEKVAEMMRDLRILCNFFALQVRFQPEKHLHLDQPTTRFDVYLL